MDKINNENELTPEELEAERNEIAAEVFDGPDIDEPLHEEDAEIEGEEVESEGAELEEEEEVDPWAGVAPALRESIESLGTRIKQTEGRVGSIQSEMQVAKNEAAKMTKGPSQEEIKDAGKSAESWQELKDEFPEWADAIDDKLAVNNAEMLKSMPDMKTIRSEVAEELRGEFDLKLITLKHPKWKQTVKSKEYLDWVDKQDAETKALHFESEDVFEAISVLDLYTDSLDKPKKTAAEIKRDRKRKLDKAVRVEPKNKKVTTRQKAESDMTRSELREKIADEVYNE